MKNVVIAGYARSPFTPAKKGKLAKVRADALAAQVVRGLVQKTGVKTEDIEDLILGCAFPEAEQGLNLGPYRGFSCRAAAFGGWRYNQPLLRFFDASHSYGRRCHSNECRRGLYLRRRRIHEPRSHAGF